MREFKEAYSILRGSVSGHINRFLNQAALNGIVYTRGKIAGGLTDGFDEVGEPSDDPTMIPDGTLKKIQGIAMARGDLTAKVEELDESELNLPPGSRTDRSANRTLGYKRARVGLTDPARGFTFIPQVNLATDLEWDTTMTPDGEYDVILRLINSHNWDDKFTPSFRGDVWAVVNSDEKWLKRLGTWATQDDTPNDDEGKLVIDNTAPKLMDFKPEL